MSYWLDDLFHGMPSFVEALCAQTDPEAFFPPKGAVPAREDPKRLCGSCADQPACLKWAMVNRERFGVWGGTSAHDRKRLAPEWGIDWAEHNPRFDHGVEPLRADPVPSGREYGEKARASLRANAAKGRAAQKARRDAERGAA